MRTFTRRQFVGTASAFLALQSLSRLKGAAPEDLEASPITNLWGRAKTRKIPVDHTTLFQGKIGRAFNHQPQLTSHQGRLIATWSLGIRDEDSPGQQMVMASSADGGTTWTEPTTIAPSTPGQFGRKTVLSSGLLAHDDLFVAYYGEWERTREGLNADGTRTANWNGVLFNLRVAARTSRNEGRTWSEAMTVMPRQVSYLPPAPTRSGRLIFPGNLTYPYTDDPAGLTGWKRVGIPGVPADYDDDFYSMHRGSQILGFKELFSEAGFFQTDDGVIHMMLRNEAGPYRGVTESHDNGQTWSRPKLTQFTDAVCRAHFGRFPDGRFFCMSCPRPPPPGKKSGERTPAILATSHDGVVFDRHYIIGDEPQGAPSLPGMAKGGRYGYPYLHLLGDQVCVIYSKYKQDICLGRFPLSALS